VYGPGVTDDARELPFATRLWFAYLCFFKVLFDGLFAGRVWGVHKGEAAPALPPAKPEPVPVPVPVPAKAEPEAPTRDEQGPALQLLALLQREGRFVDFLEEDVAGFSDAEVGAAARVVHQGCRKAVRDHAKLVPVRREAEGAKITVEAGTSPAEVKLVGNVVGSAPFTGTLVHKGWKVESLSLPQAMAGHDARIVAPAEVEL
jgi:hypothetical protein